jgi:hypothetical protein
MTTKTSKGNSATLTLLTVGVIAAGVAAVAIAAGRQALITEHAWLMMIALAMLVSPLSSIHIPGVKADVVLGDVVTFSCAVLFGPSAGVIAAVADGAITSMRLTKDTRKFLYNVATCALSMAGATVITRAFFDQFGVRTPQPSIEYLAGAVGLFTVSYFLISTGLIAAYIAFSGGHPLIRLWRQKFLWTVMSYLASGISAVVTFSLVDRLGYMVLVIVMGLMATMFFFYRIFFKTFEKQALAQNS